jgi:hypothetical protein
MRVGLRMPEFADSFVSVKRKVAEAEAALAGDGRTAGARRSVGGASSDDEPV